MANQQEEKLRQEILSDAQQKAERMVARAMVNGDRLVADARKNGEARLAKRLAEAEQRASERCSSIMLDVQREARRYRLTQRERLLEQLFAQALNQAENSQGEARSRSLAILAREAMSAIGPQSMRVVFRSADKDVVTESWLKKIAGELFGQVKIGFEMACQPDARAGLIFSSLDGQRLFDNTYVSRLEKLHDELRRQIATDK